MSQQNFDGEPPGSLSQQLKVPLLQSDDFGGKTKSSGQAQLQKYGVGGRGTDLNSNQSVGIGGDDDKDDAFHKVGENEDDGPIKPEDLQPGQENAGAGSEL